VFLKKKTEKEFKCVIRTEGALRINDPMASSTSARKSGLGAEDVTWQFEHASLR
jgi:hypothetical protein